MKGQKHEFYSSSLEYSPAFSRGFHFSGIHDKKQFYGLLYLIGFVYAHLRLGKHERKIPWNVKPKRILNLAIAVTNRVRARAIAANASATISDPVNFRRAVFRVMRNGPTTAPLNILPAWSATEAYSLII